MIVTYIKKTKYSMLCVTGVYSRKIINMFFVGHVSGLVENFYIGIYSDTIKMINVRLCMMVPLTERYLYIPLSVTLTISQGHSNVEQLYIKFLSN